jgi:ABC-type transport system substrate-binding protein
MTRQPALKRHIDTMPPQDAAFFRQQFSRRDALRAGSAVGAGFAAAGVFGALAPTAVVGRSSLQDGGLPEDAAPPENQVLRVASDPTIARVLDFYEQVYERPGLADIFSMPLVRLTKNFEIVPGAASEWSGNDDGTVWTFTLKQGLMWSDGNEVTANDYVRTFQYAADPEHAWDFAWFWSGNILNFTEAFAGDVPVEEIGVRMGANDYEVVFETVAPAPYLPAKLLYSQPLSAAALDEYGPLYNTNPDTHVSSGPFKLEEWVRDQQIVYTRNEAYTGDMEVALQRIIVKMASPATLFTLYEADQIDYMEGPAPAELQIMEADPDLAAQLYQGVGDFACLYFFFDVTTAPFDDILVRQAFSHVIDRDAMQQQIWGRQAVAAPSFLAPGFPASDTEGLGDVQAFDPELGRELLAEAGYPDGEGFPELTLTFRGGGTPLEEATVQAYVAMLNEHLSINADIQTMDRQSFYDDMSSILFGWVSYGMDFFDPSNMLGVWQSGGRHPWSNEEFDALVEEGSTSLAEADERIAIFQDAERILVEDVPAVWAYFVTPIQLVKPYLIGPALEPDNNDIAAVHWPGFATTGHALEELYVSADAPTGRE